MNDTSVSIKCKKCNQDFQPDMKTRSYWICPNCQTKNTNLKRHYRSVADLYILWLVLSIVFRLVHWGMVGFNLKFFVSLLFFILILFTIITIYKSKTPWADTTTKTLIWIVFGISLFFKLVQVAQMFMIGRFNIPFIIGFGVFYAAIFIYLFWLNSQAKKYVGSDNVTA